MARVYKFLPRKWAFDDIEKQHIKISRICDFNDPFELIPFDLTDKEQPDAQIHARTELLSRSRQRYVVFLVQVVESGVVGALR